MHAGHAKNDVKLLRNYALKDTEVKRFLEAGLHRGGCRWDQMKELSDILIGLTHISHSLREGCRSLKERGSLAE